MPADTFKILYFDFPYWRTEAARVALFMSGIEFEDKRVDREEFAKLKPELPFGQVPLLYFNGKPLAQSLAIIRFVGKKSGLYPKDDFEAAKVDAIMDHCSDITNLLTPSLREKDEARKLEMRAALAEETLPDALAKLERLLKANGNTKYFVGKSLTVADLCVWRLIGWFTSGAMDGIPKDIIAPYLLLNENIQLVDSLPKVVEWKAKHSKFYS